MTASARPEARELPKAFLAPGVLALVTVFVVVAVAVANAPWNMIDLKVYHWGGATAWHTDTVYDQVDTQDADLPFTYTPAALLVFMLMALVPVGVLQFVITIGTVLALMATLWIALGIAGFERGKGRAGLVLLLTAGAICLEPVQQTLGFGQVDVLLMLMVIGDLALKDDRRGKGVLIGLATGLKLVPGIFILYLLVTRRFRAAVVSAVTVVATIAAGFALLPTESRRYWIDGVFADSSRVGHVDFVGNQSLQGVFVRLLKHGAASALPFWLVTAILIGVGGLLLAAWAARRGEELLGIAIAALAGLLVSPISWSHHWVWVAVMMAAVASFAVRPGWSPLWVVIPLLFAVFAAYPMVEESKPRQPLGLIWSVPFRNDQELTWKGLQILVGNSYVVAGLILLACAAVFVPRVTRSR